jgi:hypothetical protein
MSSILTIAKALIALANILPFARGLFDRLTELWIDQKIKDIDEIKSDNAKKRKTILEAIKRAENDEQRKELSKLLADYASSK